LTVASLEYTDGWTESYFVPLALVSRAESERALADAPARALARITGARKGAIIDGLQDNDVCDRLLRLMADQREVATTRGSIHGVLTSGLQEAQAARAALTVEGDRKWNRGGGDQTNSLVFLNDRLALKLFRRIEPGPNPEYEVTAFLTSHGFTRVPALH